MSKPLKSLIENMTEEEIEKWNNFDSGIKLCTDMKYVTHVCYNPNHSCWKYVDGSGGEGPCCGKFRGKK